MKPDQKHARQMKGLSRYAQIALLLEEGLPEAELKRRRMFVSEDAGVSARTVRRWLKAYRSGGFDALVPKERRDKGSCRAIPEDAMKLAEEFRKELPRRSAALITRHLNNQGHAIARSTLERQLRQRGLSGKELVYRDCTASRRFVKTGRNSLWQTDIKYGPYIPDPNKPGKNIRTYLLVIIDDATRFVVHAAFYTDQRQPILEHGLRCAVQSCGSPKELYADNGKIFVSNWLKYACARLNIRLINTKPYSPEAKGKVERFNRTVEEFYSESTLINVASVDELNELFRVWLYESYQHKPHSSLGGESPAGKYAQDSTPVRFHNPETLADCFLWEATRGVDKSGCLSLNGKVYEAGTAYIRKKVQLRFDPFNTETLQLWHNGQKVKEICRLTPAEYNNVQKKAPEQPVKPGQSRILTALAEENRKRYKKQLGAFRMSGGSEDV